MTKTIRYVGHRPEGHRPNFTRVLDDGTVEPLRQTIVHHSPTGMEMGYGGSGPSDLALNILADYLGGVPQSGLPVWAWGCHNELKFRFFADHEQRDHFELTREQVTAFLAERGIVEVTDADQDR